MNTDIRELIERLNRAELDHANTEPAAQPQRTSGLVQGQPEIAPGTIHYTQLPDPIPGSPIAAEWDYYRREVGRLLTDGQEGKWVLIKGESIVGIWNTEEEADRVRIEQFLMRPVLLKQILTLEPVLRGGGYSTMGIGGSVAVNIYRVSLHIWDKRNRGLPWLTQPSLLVMNLVPGFPLDVLIGMDVVRDCILTVDGPAGWFTLDF